MNRAPLVAPVFLVFAWASLLAACAPDRNTQPPPAHDAASFDDAAVAPTLDAAADAPVDAPDEAAACESGAAPSCADLAFPSASVTYATSSGALPLASGGAIEPGTYALASQTTYTSTTTTSDAGAPLVTSALSFDSCAHFVFTSFSTVGTVTVASTLAGTYTATGTTLRLVEDCPSVEGLSPLLYTATSSGITLIEPADPLNGTPAGVSVYAKQ